MKKKRLWIIVSFIVLAGLFTYYFFDLNHEPVETIDELVGQNYDFAYKMYFKSDPDKFYWVNVNDPLNEADGAILSKKHMLTDSIVHVYTWSFWNHQKTIWVGETKNMKMEVLDAIRYKNNVAF